VSENGTERPAANRDAAPHKISIADRFTAETYAWSVQCTAALTHPVLLIWLAKNITVAFNMTIIIFP